MQLRLGLLRNFALEKAFQYRLEGCAVLLHKIGASENDKLNLPDTCDNMNQMKIRRIGNVPEKHSERSRGQCVKQKSFVQSVRQVQMKKR